MKKFSLALLSLLLTVCMAATAFAAEADPFGKYEEPITLTTARAMDPTVTFDESNPERASFESNKLITAYKDRLNIDVKFDWIASDGEANNTKWNAAIASGDLPDFAMVSDNIYALLVDAGYVADCTDAFYNYASDEYKALLSEDQISQLTVDGVLYGIPWPTHNYYSDMIYIRQDWLDQLGLAYPTSMEEVIEVAKAFKENKMGGEDTIAILLATNENPADGSITGMLNAFGAIDSYWVEKDGKLAWSNIQPEMREALLQMQKLYADGVFNQDFTVVNGALAAEYVANGKTGVVFGDSWNATSSISTLYANNPAAKMIPHCILPMAGKPVMFQGSTSSAGKVFVNKDCEHPEAVMKLINLQLYQQNYETSEYYSSPDGTFSMFKLSWNGTFPCSVSNDMDKAYEIEQAYKAGAKNADEWDGWSSPLFKAGYDSYVQAMNGEGAYWRTEIYGEGGSYTLLYYAIQNGEIVLNKYVGLPTETMALMGNTVNDKLITAMYEVIMGADISVYDAACEAWLANGGQDITDEVNAAVGK